MVKMSRSYLQKGHLSLIWQDDVFFYSYFLWFEDSHGTQLKPKEIPNTSSANAIKPHVVPGVISGEFYQLVLTPMHLISIYLTQLRLLTFFLHISDGSLRCASRRIAVKLSVSSCTACTWV